MQMGEGISGSLIYEVDPLSQAAGVLKPNDVLLEVDGEQQMPSLNIPKIPTSLV